MVLGEKVGEEKGKATGMSIKSIGPEGMTIEVSFVSEVKGFGRYSGGRNMGTLTVIQGPSTHKTAGQGIFVTTDGESLPWHVVGTGKRVGGRDRGIGLVTFSTRSQKYAWVNDGLYVLDSEASPDFSEFSDISYEWK
jgi:hypothetical protein